MTKTIRLTVRSVENTVKGQRVMFEYPDDSPPDPKSRVFVMLAGTDDQGFTPGEAINVTIASVGG